MKEFNAKKIIIKYLANEATAAEYEHLLVWAKAEKNQKLFKEFLKAQQLIDIVYTDTDSDAAFDEFLKEIVKEKNKYNSPFKNFATFLKYAAILIGLSISLLYFIKKDPTTSLYKVSKTEVSLQVLDENNDYFQMDVNQTFKTQNGVEFAVVDKGVLKYLPNNDKNLQHILTVPYGKIFKVILSDGSSVHLNSGSTLKYPSRFKDNEPRLVYLEGEAFFNVSKMDSNSFIVNSKYSSTKVYGTEFNVSSYLDDELTEVVLVEGSVGVKNKSSSQQRYTVITPSQKAVLSDKTRDVEISHVNITKYIAWKDGDLVFENEKFENIKKILERHYNIKIINHFHDLDKFKYNGNFQNDSIEKILNTIKLHTNFSYKRDGDTILINNPKDKK